jgi:hypothetical protein
MSNDQAILAHLDAADVALATAHTEIANARALIAPPAPTVRYPLAITDYTIRAKPGLPALGPAGCIIADPCFGSSILRVTDQHTADGTSCRVASNAHLAGWSADNRAFFILTGSGVRVFRFDEDAFTVAPAGEPYAQGEPCWSRTDPDALYTVGGSQTRTIRRWSLSRNTFEDVLDLDMLVPGLADPRTYVGGIISGGGDSLVVFFGGQGQDSHYLASVLRPGSVPPAVLNTRETLGITLHSAAIDLLGRYVLLYSTNEDINAGRPKQICWDTSVALDDPAAFQPVTVCPWGHDALGFGWRVNQDTTGKQPYDGRQWVLRSLDDVSQADDLINPQPTPPETYVSDHTSWNCDQPNALQPVLSATFRDDNPSRPPAPWGTWDDEIIAIATDGSGTVFRFAHHRSNVRDEQDDTQFDFWSQPMPNVSPDGRQMLFTSNWERSVGRDAAGAVRQDVFLIALR